MKEKMKKRLIIVGLAAAAVCLSVGLGLFLYTKNGNAMPAVATGKTDITEEVVVPKITLPEKETEEAESVSETATEEESDGIEDESTSGSGATGSTTATQKPSAGKPKTPEEVILPEEPSELKNPEAEISPEETPEYVEPVTEETPKGGERRDDGAIYVPGFGYIKGSGEPNQSIDTDNGMHNGNMVGEM